RGWRPRASWLLAAGLVATAAFAVLPPVGSSDHLNYAAYGHMAASGIDPYVTKAAELPPGDVYGDAVEEWRDTPSIYGPIVTAGQWLAAEVGGDSVRTTVFVLSLLNGLAFALAGLVLYFRTGDQAARLRSVLLWTANPLLLFHLVSGAHNDVWAVAVAVIALTVFTRGASSLWRTFGTGLVVGTAVAIKLPAGLVGGGPAWSLWREGRDRRSLVALFGGAALAAGTAFAIAGPRALDQVANASDFVALANPWHLFGGAGHGVLNLNVPKPVISLLSLALLVYLVKLLAKALPQADDRDVLRVSAALVLGWLFAAAYVLPWYDGLGYAVLAFLPWSRFDGLLVLRTTLLSLGYLPARAPATSGLPDSLGWLITVLRAEIMPCVLASVLALLIWTARRPDPAPAP
ncbi:polyprenol phosphomannose-dependent alpha 1,6 mannosyltransferase MptB, partial [Actinocorallia lasiicapitis]